MKEIYYSGEKGGEEREREGTARGIRNLVRMRLGSQILNQQHNRKRKGGGIYEGS